MGESGDLTFGLYVSSVEGQPVSRFGTKVLIGAERDPETRNKIRYRTKDVVGIPTEEANRYAREYARLIADGALIERTADDYQQQQQQRSEAGAPRQKLMRAGQHPPDQPKTETTPDADESRS